MRRIALRSPASERPPTLSDIHQIFRTLVAPCVDTGTLVVVSMSRVSKYSFLPPDGFSPRDADVWLHFLFLWARTYFVLFVCFQGLECEFRGRRASSPLMGEREIVSFSGKKLTKHHFSTFHSTLGSWPPIRAHLNRSARFGRGTRGPSRLTPVCPIAGSTSTHSRTTQRSRENQMVDVSQVRHRSWPILRAPARRGPAHRVLAHPLAARNWLALPHCRCTRQGPKQRLRRRLLRGVAQVPAESAEVEATAVAQNAAWQTAKWRRPHGPSPIDTPALSTTVPCERTAPPRRPGRRVHTPAWAGRCRSKHALRSLSHLMLLSLASGFMLPRDARAAGARDVPLEVATAEAAATSGGSGVRRRLGGSECDESWCDAMAAGHVVTAAPPPCAPLTPPSGAARSDEGRTCNANNQDCDEGGHGPRSCDTSCNHRSGGSCDGFSENSRNDGPCDDHANCKECENNQNCDDVRNGKHAPDTRWGWCRGWCDDGCDTGAKGNDLSCDAGSTCNAHTQACDDSCDSGCSCGADKYGAAKHHHHSYPQP